MKVNGIKLTGTRVVEVYLPFNGEDVCFKFRPLKADEDFSKVMTKPVPKQVLKPGNVVHYLTDAPVYREQLGKWVTNKLDWEFLKCISITDGLEFATIDPEKSETWGNWRTEIGEHFGDSATEAVWKGFMEAQYITEEVMEKSRARFLTSPRELQENLSSQLEEAMNTLSGEPANG